MKTVHPAEGETFDIELEESLLQKNQELARKNRELLDKYHIHAVDILGSIGSGKTSLVEKLVDHLRGTYRTAAVAGDLTTTIDADRIQEKGAVVIQVNTGKECHLDANLVKKALAELDLGNLDLIFIENVGNLICPGEFPLGADQRIVVVSTTEGPYMIVKHPYIFMDASVLVINKIDLADAMEVDIRQLKKDALGIKPSLKVVFTNARTGQGIPELIEALNLPKK
ncbi:MAG: hydrogenase nickel incorporation protein HypB [bacterium]